MIPQPTSFYIRNYPCQLIGWQQQQFNSKQANISMTARKWRTRELTLKTECATNWAAIVDLNCSARKWLQLINYTISLTCAKSYFMTSGLVPGNQQMRVTGVEIIKIERWHLTNVWNFSDFVKLTKYIKPLTNNKVTVAPRSLVKSQRAHLLRRSAEDLWGV